MVEKRLALVIGLGKIGKPIHSMLVQAYGANEVKGIDLIKGPREWDSPFKFMHVCFPPGVDFREQMAQYLKKYDPEHVIIHSTLSPGMTSLLDGEFSSGYDPGRDYYPSIFYSPVRGNIRDGMEWSLRRYTKYLAPEKANHFRELDEAAAHLSGAGFKVKTTKSSEALEWAKLLDLAWYALNIAFYQELERITGAGYEPGERIWTGSDYGLIREFIESTPIESEGRVPRLVFYGGHIGGECVIQAVEKILAKDPNCTLRMMLRAIIESNMKRKTELMIRKPPHHP